MASSATPIQLVQIGDGGVRLTETSERCEAPRTRPEQGDEVAAELRHASRNPRASAGKH